MHLAAEDSRDFMRLIEDKEKLQELISGSHAKNASFELWKSMRFCITKAINKDGTILDIGCANGFLLRCLQEWCGYRLEPYGIDSDARNIEDAKRLFPKKPQNFMVRELFDLEEEGKKGAVFPGFPEKFDFIYWNVGDNCKFEGEMEILTVRMLLGLVSHGGRLILGFYESYANKEMAIDNLRKAGFEFSGSAKNYRDMLKNPPNELITWIDR